MRLGITKIFITLIALVLVLAIAPVGIGVNASNTWTEFDPQEWPTDSKCVYDKVEDMEKEINAQFGETSYLHVIAFLGYRYKDETGGYRFWRQGTGEKFTCDTSYNASTKDEYMYLYNKYPNDPTVAVYVKRRELKDFVPVNTVSDIPTSVEVLDRGDAKEKLNQQLSNTDVQTPLVILAIDGNVYTTASFRSEERIEGGSIYYYPEIHYTDLASLQQMVNSLSSSHYYYIPRSSTPGKADEGNAGSKEGLQNHECDDYDVEWSVSTPATETTNGVMVAKCKGCGAIKYEVSISPMTVWNSNMTAQIRNAKPGTTVVIDAHDFKSIHRSVLDAFRQNPNVNIQFDWLDENKKAQTVTIPAGSAEKLNALFNLDRKNVDQDGNGMFCGFKAMVGQF